MRGVVGRRAGRAVAEGEGRRFLGHRKGLGSVRGRPGRGPQKAGVTHLLLRLESCEPCCLRAGPGSAGAARSAPGTRVSAPPPASCRRCTCHRAAACAPTPCRAAAARGPGRPHLPSGHWARRRGGAQADAASAALPAPGSRRSSPATDTAACAPRPWRGPGRPRVHSSSRVASRGDPPEARGAGPSKV